MEKDIINHPKLNYRYSKSLNTIYIDIKIDFYREIYNVWDFSPLINRDLDDDLFEYLESSAMEIPKKYNICIVFHLHNSKKDVKLEEKSIKGFQNYFNYQIRKINLKQKSNIRKILLYGILGFALIFFGYFIRNISISIPFIDVLSEGFFIGGWVLFWELFSGIFFKRSDMKNRGDVLTRLLKAGIVYEYYLQ
jgi:hypothetical protein